MLAVPTPTYAKRMEKQRKNRINRSYWFWLSYDTPFFVTVTRSLPDVTSNFSSWYWVKHLMQYLIKSKIASTTAGVRILPNEFTISPFVTKLTTIGKIRKFVYVSKMCIITFLRTWYKSVVILVDWLQIVYTHHTNYITQRAKNK